MKKNQTTKNHFIFEPILPVFVWAFLSAKLHCEFINSSNEKAGVFGFSEAGICDIFIELYENIESYIDPFYVVCLRKKRGCQLQLKPDLLLLSTVIKDRFYCSVASYLCIAKKNQLESTAFYITQRCKKLPKRRATD